MIPIRAALASLLVVALGACSPDADDGPGLLRGGGGGGSIHVPPGVEVPAVRTLRDAELVRGGGWSAGAPGFALVGLGAVLGTDAGRAEDGKDLGLQLDAGPATGSTQSMVQALMLPDRITRARFRVAYRIGGYDASHLQRFEIAIGELGPTDAVPSLVMVMHDPSRLPSAGWKDIDVELDARSLRALESLRKQKKQAVLYARLVGNGARAHIDDLSLRVDGERDLPKLPGRLSYADDVKGEAIALRSVDPHGLKTVTHWTSPRPHTAVKGLAWSPDGQTLVFASDHDMAWSPFTTDLFAIEAEGMRKLTNPRAINPAVAKARPTGSVEVRVQNLLGAARSDLVVCVEGGSVHAPLVLAPHGEATAAVHGVRDFGAGVLQQVWVRAGGRTLWAGSGVDVQAGATATLPGVFSIGDLRSHEVTQPSFHHGGKHMVVSIGGLHTLPLAGGVPSKEHVGHLMGTSPRYAPGDDRILYSGFGGLQVLEPGADQATPVGPRDAGLVESPRWMPGGRRFMYVAQARDPLLGLYTQELHLQPLHSGSARAITRHFGEAITYPAVSPDGRFIAYRRAPPSGGRGTLWIMPLDDPGGAWPIETRGDPVHLVWRR